MDEVDPVVHAFCEALIHLLESSLYSFSTGLFGLLTPHFHLFAGHSLG